MTSRTNDIVARFVALLAETTGNLLGPKEISMLVPEITIRTGIARLWRGKVESRIDASDRVQVQTKVGVLVHGLERAFGTELAESKLEDVYTRLEKEYAPALANEFVLPLVPEHHLEKYRLRMFSKEELASMLEHERERDRELAKANSELREIDRRKSEFISVVAHQLRTPLSGFKWALDLLRKGQAGPVSPEQEKVLKNSSEANERMMGLVEEMLHADRIEAGRFSITPAPVDLEVLLRNIVSSVAATASEMHVTLAFERPGEPLPKMLLDPDKIRAVFQNVLDNALRYSRPEGVVTISVRKGDKEVVVEVADQGIGIPKDQEAEIFSRFFRAKNARLAVPDGNGLGLYIAKNILTLHGGSIRFESREDKGTTFFVTLPL